MKIKLDDIPEALPPHPDEARLREGERQLAVTLRDLTDKICTALESGSPDKSKARVDAYVGLSLLVDTAAAARAAEANAIQQQMDLLKSG